MENVINLRVANPTYTSAVGLSSSGSNRPPPLAQHYRGDASKEEIVNRHVSRFNMT